MIEKLKIAEFNEVYLGNPYGAFMALFKTLNELVEAVNELEKYRLVDKIELKKDIVRIYQDSNRKT